MLLAAALILGGYLVGSFPTGVVLGRFVGRDPRKGGSGNIGATNVTRTLGRKWGAVTLLVDVAKGWAPVYVASVLGASLGVACGAGFAAVVGHCFPVWLKLRGGKGVATAFGLMLALDYKIALLGAALWIAVFVFTRVAALGSLAAASLFVVGARIDDLPFAVQLLTLCLLCLILVRHASNLRQIRAVYRKRRTTPRTINLGRKRPRSRR